MSYLPTPVSVRPNRPFVYLNAAISADGKLAPANRVFEPFTNGYDQNFLYLLRTRADAVMAGARTVASSDVTMDSGGGRFEAIRLREGRSRHNLRIVVSASGNVSPRLRIFEVKSSPVILLTTARANPAALANLKGVADVVPCGDKVVDWNVALTHLWKHWGVRSLLCEGGGELNGALVEAGMVDEIYLTVAPVIFGGHHAPTLADGNGFPTLSKATTLVLKHRFRRANNLFLCYKVSVGLPAKT
ncbi:MAG: hypothetical protein DVB32_10505 [Verrucomicrobia bacterium]|nr:MAG: hypothetical protein DVB32_10505 [Verrucomicrobiota bacterium]